MTFYEINPLVIEVANSRFDFLRDSHAHIDIIPGDARISLQRQPSQNFDLLLADAFSGDAIPVHLLTLESFQLYFRHLRPDGLLAIHISNKFLDLKPVVEAPARCHRRDGPDGQDALGPGRLANHNSRISAAKRSETIADRRQFTREREIAS